MQRGYDSAISPRQCVFSPRVRPALNRSWYTQSVDASSRLLSRAIQLHRRRRRGCDSGKIEFLGQRLEVDSGQAGHAVEELFEFRRLGIQLFEDAFSAVLGFVLRLPGAKRFRQVMPELEQPCVQHLGDSADVARALAVEVERAAAGVLEYFASAPSPSRSRNF